MLEVGKIVNTHGLRGEVKVVPWTDTPDVFEELASVFYDNRGVLEEHTIESVKYQKNNIILKLEDIGSIEEATLLRGKVLRTEREQLGELPEGTYYIADLIGCAVEDESHNPIGEMVEVLQPAGNDVYVVRREGKRDLLLPKIDECILNVDIKNKLITAHVLDGLDDEV